MTETRAEKAQRLVDEGRVGHVYAGLLRTTSSVQGDLAFYHVILFDSGHYFCDCDWGRFHSYTDDLCAHALAVKLAAEKENESCIPSEPI